MRFAWVGLLLLAIPASAGVDPRSYDRAVDLVDRMYLYPKEVSAASLLQASANALAARLHWLVVEADGDAVYLRHGDGSPVGAVSVAHLGTLAEALRALEDVVLAAGYPLDGVDVRLELLSGLGDGLDRYSQVLEGERLERFDVRLKGTLVGVGITLRRDGEHLAIGEVLAESPAAAAGVRAGDRLMRIDGWSTMNMPVREASRRVRGEVGAPVTLTLARDGEELAITVARAEIVERNVLHEVLPGNVGYVAITHFSQRTVENLTVAMRELRAAGALDHGLVIDLRGNTGGSMNEAGKSADFFVKDGLLLRTAGRGGREVQNLQAEMRAADDGNEPQIPVAILVDDKTASGSEILAGALVQLDRAALVGSRTFGKGTVQKVYTLDEATRLKLTVAEYLLAGDRRIADGGLVPDLTVRPVRLESHGARFQGWDPTALGVGWSAVLPAVDEQEGWRGEARPSGDLERELARRAVLAANGPTRAALQAALAEVAAEERALQEAALLDAFAARELDWSPAEAPGGPPEAEVRLRAEPVEGHPDSLALRAEVQNLGSEPLHRVMVAVKSPEFSSWDGLVIPVGRVEPGATGEGSLRVALRPGIQSREDEVQLQLWTDQRPDHPAGSATLRAASSERPRLGVEAKLVGQGSERKAEITLRNHARHGLVGVEVSFEFPGEVDLDLVDSAARVPLLLGGQEATVELGLRLGPGAPAELPLSLHVEVERYGELIDGWPLALPVAGGSVALAPPVVALAKGEAPLAAPAGPFRWPLKVTDDRSLAHTVVWLNGEKVGWSGGGGPITSLVAEGAWQTGVNRLQVVATDDQGLVTRRQWVVRGEPAVTVDAGG